MINLKDIITIVTAITGAILGIINMVFYIHSKNEENITIYSDEIRFDYEFNRSEYLNGDNYWEVPLNLDCVLYVLNNKNRAVVIEAMRFGIKMSNDHLKVPFEFPKARHILVNNHDMQKINDCIQCTLLINNKGLEKIRGRIFYESIVAYLWIDGKKYIKNIDIIFDVTIK